MACFVWQFEKTKEDEVDGFLDTSEIDIRYVTNFTGNKHSFNHGP